MRNAISMFTTIISPLSELLGEVYPLAGKRTKRSILHIQLYNICTTAHNDAFGEFKNALVNQVILAHKNVSLRLFVYTDASDLAWFGVVT